MKKTITLMLAFLLPASLAQAIENFFVKDIRVEGLQRIAPGTVFNYLPIKVGDSLTELNARDAIAALFKTGFFQDVRLERSGDVLVVHVTERPSVDSIKISGTKEIDEKELLKSLKELGLAEGLVFNSSLLDKTEQELKRQYFSRGRYAVNVKTTVTPLERNRVGIRIDVAEGEVTTIHGITIVGNRIFKDNELLKTFSLSTSTLFSFYTKSDQYSKQKLAADLENLRNFYQNQGYLDFTIDSTQVSITPDKQDIYVTVNITEGRKYTVTDVKLGGKLIVPEAELRKLISVKAGDVFSRQEITDSSKRISDRLGNDGYAFANVNAAPEIDKEKKQVAFTLFVDPGRRVYVRRIQVQGNTRTRDEVVRREMRQMEAGWYDGAKINRSRARVDKLGYFDEVTVETPAVPGTTDQVDLNVNVKEKATGNMMLGAGLSSTEGLVLSGSVQQQNLFGSGKHVAVGFNTSKINTLYSFSYTDPYHTVDGVSRGFDLYYKDTDTAELNTIATYATKSYGGGVRYGYPIGEDNRINFGLAFDSTEVKETTNTPLRYKAFLAEYGTDYTGAILSVGWGKDTLDSRIYPMQGYVATAGAELAMGTDALGYYRANLKYQQYFPIGREYALMINGELGWADGIGEDPLPFWKYYYAGGVGSVRGYKAGSLGPIDPLTEDRLGGKHRLITNAEFLFPMPGSGLDKSLRLGVFMDAGKVWGADYGLYNPADEDMRYSAGLSLAWSSPLGPLKFSLAQPLNEKDGDDIQRLQFQMGTTF
jgi:outer membrane protein insertion porin family